ncbi:hypothetical protein H5410_036007 [Solanum commersonii]|uniref:Ubiquitin-like protease family profile domain-containing protein n=1 Tax=Solanum commersonii TaxID=4109 RepID=A0A9J5Y4F5_SOLCO|nr:hypothetical protein H5410_036007 [Solanum commersonii]
MDFVVAFSKDKNWFYAISQPKNVGQMSLYNHIDVVFNYLRKKSKLRSPNQYRFTTVNCLFKTYINNTHTRYYCNPPDDNLSMHEHMEHGAVEFTFESSIKNIINGFSVSVGLLWHLVYDVYISVNSDEKFHWVLAVIALKERLIRVYNTSLSTRKKVPSVEIKKLATMLPSYLRDNVEFLHNIMQQDCDNLGYRFFVAAFAEFLSDGILVPSNGFRSDFYRTRYAALLWEYDIEKAKAGYVSPPRPKSQFTSAAQEDLVNVE